MPNIVGEDHVSSITSAATTLRILRKMKIIEVDESENEAFDKIVNLVETSVYIIPNKD